MWASSLHRRYLLDNAGDRTPPQQEPAGPRGPESIRTDAWANLANALVALQATAARSTATPVTKKGFDAFPITTQQMILFASERAAGGGARAAPVDIYTEILGLGLTNAAYIAALMQHLHHHLKARLGLDVWLPAGFCLVVRMASFIASTNDQPEAFSLFSCGPQPFKKRPTAGITDKSESADDLMRMQLKVVDSTTGLSDKDIKKLTIIRHVAPRDFRELAGLFESMAGVTELVFGQALPITMMLTSWVHFLTRTGGMTMANLRRLAYVDVTTPIRLGWFVERRIQQYMTACASNDHIDRVSVLLFDFQVERQQLEDGVLVHPLCPYNFDFQVERQQLEDGVLVHPLCPYEEQLELFTCFAAAIREDDPRQIPEDLMNLALDARQAPFVPPSTA